MNWINRTLLVILLVAIGLFAGLNWQVYQNLERLETTMVQQTEILTSTVSKKERSFDMDRPHLSEVANDVTNSVVFIESEISIKDALPDDGNHDFGDRFWRRFGPGRTTAAGSGIIISADGYILTNNHVIEEAEEDGIMVHLSDRRRYPARVVGTDPSTDLAVLKINGEQFEPIIFGDSEDVMIGDWVVAIGNPLRLRSTVTAGIVSALGRSMDIINDRMRVESFIQTDAAINQGNSGGALVNIRGELVGVNTAIATRTGSYQGYGFAIPSNLAKKVAIDLMETGSVRRALIGISINSVDYDQAIELGLEKIGGVYIADVMPGGAADMAEIEAGDIILDVDGYDVLEVNSLQEKIAMHLPGDKVVLGIYRDGDFLKKEVQLQSAPQAEMAANRTETLEESSENENPQNEVDPEVEGDDEITEENEDSFVPESGFGLRTFPFEELGFTLMELDRTEEGRGIEYLISKVEADSFLGKQGLRSGQIIVKIDGYKPKSMQHIVDRLNVAVSNSEKVSILLQRPNGKRLQLYFKYK